MSEILLSAGNTNRMFAKIILKHCFKDGGEKTSHLEYILHEEYQIGNSVLLEQIHILPNLFRIHANGAPDFEMSPASIRPLTQGTGESNNAGHCQVE